MLERVRAGRYAVKKIRAKVTERRMQTLVLICEGLSHKQIAPILGISIKTVEKHRGELNRRANVHCGIDLYKWAVAHGYVDAPARLDK